MPTWLPRHTHILPPSHANFSHPHGPVGRRGRKVTSLLLDKRGKVAKHSCLRVTDPDIPSPAGTLAPNTVPSLCLALALFFELVLFFWSWCSGYHLQGCQPIVPWDTPPPGQKLMMSLFAQPTASHATTSPNCSNTLRTSGNEMLNRSKLEKAVRLHMLDL